MNRVLRINLFYWKGSITVAFIAPWWLGFMNENEIKSLFKMRWIHYKISCFTIISKLSKVQCRTQTSCGEEKEQVNIRVFDISLNSASVSFSLFLWFYFVDAEHWPETNASCSTFHNNSLRLYHLNSWVHLLYLYHVKYKRQIFPPESRSQSFDNKKSCVTFQHEKTERLNVSHIVFPREKSHQIETFRRQKTSVSDEISKWLC